MPRFPRLTLAHCPTDCVWQLPSRKVYPTRPCPSCHAATHTLRSLSAGVVCHIHVLYNYSCLNFSHERRKSWGRASANEWVCSYCICLSRAQHVMKLLKHTNMRRNGIGSLFLCGVYVASSALCLCLSSLLRYYQVQNTLWGLFSLPLSLSFPSPFLALQPTRSPEWLDDNDSCAAVGLNSLTYPTCIVIT